MLALCGTVICAMPMMAQDTTPTPATQAGPPPGGRGGPGGGERQLKMLTKKLNLTPDQVTQVKAIDADTRTQSEAVRSDSSLSQADKRSKMMDIHKASQDKIRAVLTPDQQTKYDAMLTEMQQRRQNGGGGTPPAAPPQ